MSCAAIAFTRRGAELGRRLAAALGASLHVPPRLSEELGLPGYESLEGWTAEHWAAGEDLLFIGACGIAVRAIAPHVKDKFSDPAVVAVDEAGRFAVPLLSGHVGGANDLCRQVARLTGGEAAISTATDVNGLWAVDVWARDMGLVIGDRVLAKKVSAALLEKRCVGFASDFPVEGDLPAGLRSEKILPAVHVTCGAAEAAEVLRLIPRCLTLGIGCRKGTAEEAIAAAVDAALQKADLDPRAVAAAASIDLKAEEPGLLAFCRSRALPLRTYTAEELAAVPGDFTPSAFVRSVTGVDNVCERAALKSGGTLLLPKQAGNGVTVAIAIQTPLLKFDRM